MLYKKEESLFKKRIIISLTFTRKIDMDLYKHVTNEVRSMQNLAAFFFHNMF